MKRITFIISVLCLALVFVTCQKEGEFTPSKRISKIYLNGKISEIWSWNKKTLDKIDHYNSNGVCSSTEYFSYDKGRLSEVVERFHDVDFENYFYKYEFEYVGGKLDKINGYSLNTLVETFKVAHKNGKISRLDGVFLSDHDEYDEHDEYEKKQMPRRSFCLPDATIKHQIEDLKSHISHNRNIKSSSKFSLEYTWEGKNIVKITESESGLPFAENTYAYDKNSNPRYGLIYASFCGIGEDETSSKNNVVEYNYSDLDGWYESYHYVYTYDGKYPIRYTSDDGDVIEIEYE